jgi:hypothetical protein
VVSAQKVKEINPEGWGWNPGSISISDAGRGRPYPAHQLMIEITRGRLPNTNALVHANSSLFPGVAFCGALLKARDLNEGIGVDGERSGDFRNLAPAFEPAYICFIWFGSGSSGSVCRRAKGGNKFCLDRAKSGGLTFVR